MDNLTQTASREFGSFRIFINNSYDTSSEVLALFMENSVSTPMCEARTVFEALNIFEKSVSPDSSLGEVGGVLTALGEPFTGLALLYDEASGELAASTISDVNGVFLFKNLPTNKRFYVVGINPDLTMNHSIRAHMQPSP